MNCWTSCEIVSFSRRTAPRGLISWC